MLLFLQFSFLINTPTKIDDSSFEKPPNSFKDRNSKALIFALTKDST